MLLKSWLVPSVLALSLSLPAGAAPPPSVPRGPEFRINTSTATSHFFPSIAAFPDGGFVVVWNSDVTRARFLDAQGRPRREVRLPISGIAEQVTAGRDGSFLVVSYGSTPSSPATGIFVRRFNRDGTPRGPRIRVSNLSPSDRRNPLIAIGPNDRFAVAWEADVRIQGTDGTYSNAVGRIFAADGTPLTSEILLGEGEPANAAGDNAIDVYPTALALRPDGTLVAQIQETEGGGCRRSFLVERSPDGELSDAIGLGSLLCSAAGQSPGSLALRPNGALITAWTEDEVRAQRFGPDLTPLEDWFGVSDEDEHDEDDPAIALQPGGRFVIAWTEENLDGESRGIFGRSFAANGTPRTGDFQINLTTEGEQLDPAIAAAARGGIVVVVWAQQREQNGRSDIFARVLAPQP